MRSTPRRPARPRLTTLAALVAATATLGACGGEDDDDAPVEVIGTARVVDAPPVVEIENRTVLRSVPVNALARPEPVAPVPAAEPVVPAAEPAARVDDPVAPPADPVAPAAGLVAGAGTDGGDEIPLTDPDADAGADENLQAESGVDPAVDAAAEAVNDGPETEVPIAETKNEPTEKPDSATAEVAGRSGEQPAATVATSIEEVIIAPEATTADAEVAAAAIGANAAAPVAADTLIAETDVTPSVPDNTSDNPPWNSLVSDWTGSVKLLRERFGDDLDEDELMATNGDRNQVVSIMEERMGIDRADAESRLDDFARSRGEGS